MGKKKNKKKNDARGYAVTSSSNNNTSRTSTAPTPPAITKSIDSNNNIQQQKKTTTNVTISVNIQETLEELLQLLVIDEQENNNPEPLLHDDARFRSRLANVYDTLINLGFTLDAIKTVVGSIGANITIESALDWFCLHLPTNELPPLFTEGSVRDAVLHSTTTESSLSVISAPNKKKITNTSSTNIITENDNNHETNNKSDLHNNNIIVSDKQMNPRNNESIEDQHKDEKDKLDEKQKAWILSQYQFGEDDEQEKYDNEQIVDTEDQNLNNNNDTTEDNNNKNDETLSPDELRLQRMKQELDELQADVGNEANNYMRSKVEIKQLKKQLATLKSQVFALERKVENEKRRQKEAAREQHDDEEDCGGWGGGLFGGDNEDDDDNDQPDITPADNVKVTANDKVDYTPPTLIEIPNESIPKSWTGKTPKSILEEWCRKEKVPRPTFQNLNPCGCTVRVKLQNDIVEIEELNVRGSNAMIHHYMAILAMYNINPNLQLYRLFPPFYRDLWLDWKTAEQQTAEEIERIESEKRQNILQDLVDCIPKGNNVPKSQKANNEIDVVSSDENAKETWDESESERFSQKAMDSELGEKLKEMFLQKRKSPDYQKMLTEREKLPIYAYKDTILSTIQNNPVTIISAETGSGKTTQCSSFVLEEALAAGFGDKTSIICTQPRRVAATSVAERVSDELAESTVGKLVGYQIRMESMRSSATRLLFCTTGVILRRLMEGDRTLAGISHVVVDEVHERQWQIDVLLVSLRALLRGPRPDLKVILMSATLDADVFSSFFGEAPVVVVPGRTFPVSTYYLEDLLENTGHIIEEGSRYSRRDFSKRETVSLMVTTRGGEKHRETADYQMHEEVSNNFPGYSILTRKSMDRVEESVINYDLIEEILTILFEGNKSESPFPPPDSCKIIDHGAVLIFLPGIGEIRFLADRLSGSRLFGDSSRFIIVPMHSTLSSADQRRAFHPAGKGRRKIILSTNIAETSVTIPDVVYVIDSGRVREIQRDRRTASRKLVSTWCSKANAKQRAGRAGRVQSGVCLKLYSSLTQQRTMRKASEPELRRIPLEEVCLTILASGITSNCSSFLSQTPQPPTEDAIRSAVMVLQDIGAISFIEDSSTNELGYRERREKLTALGRHLSKLPVDARVGKMLIFGALFDCLDAVLTIAASLSASKSPFASSFDDAQQVKATQALFTHPFSDFYTLLNVWDGFKQAQKAGNARKFCREKYLNFSTLCEIQDARLHYLDLLCGLGFLDSKLFLVDNSRKHLFDEQKIAKSSKSRNCNNEGVVHSVVCAGLYPNVARVNKIDSGKDVSVSHKNEHLFIQSSVNSKLSKQTPSDWLTFFEKFGTERRVSISQTAFVSPFALLLFGSNIQILHTKRKVIIDGWIELTVAAKTATIFREIRARLDVLVKSMIEETHSSRQPQKLLATTHTTIEKILLLLSSYGKQR